MRQGWDMGGGTLYRGSEENATSMMFSMVMCLEFVIVFNLESEATLGGQWW